MKKIILKKSLSLESILRILTAIVSIIDILKQIIHLAQWELEKPTSANVGFSLFLDEDTKENFSIYLLYHIFYIVNIYFKIF